MEPILDHCGVMYSHDTMTQNHTGSKQTFPILNFWSSVLDITEGIKTNTILNHKKKSSCRAPETYATLSSVR